MKKFVILFLCGLISMQTHAKTEMLVTFTSDFFLTTSAQDGQMLDQSISFELNDLVTSLKRDFKSIQSHGESMILLFIDYTARNTLLKRGQWESFKDSMKMERWMFHVLQEEVVANRIAKELPQNTWHVRIRENSPAIVAASEKRGWIVDGETTYSEQLIQNTLELDSPQIFAELSAMDADYIDGSSLLKSLKILCDAKAQEEEYRLISSIIEQKGIVFVTIKTRGDGS